MAWNENISENERKAIEELKKRTAKYMTPKMLEDETLFYRFCKARNFNIDMAETMLMKHIAWRKEWQIETLLENYKKPDVLEKYYPSSFVCFDKEGCVVRYIDYGLADIKGIRNSVSLKELQYTLYYFMEEDLERMKQSNKKTGKQATTVSVIYNLGNLTLAKITDKKSVEWLMSSFKLYQDNYPERLKNTIIINAAAFFPIVFPLFKAIIAPTILEKIHCFGQDGWKEYLRDVIDTDELPAFLGGNRKDPDGDPLCKSYINHGGEIPQSYYRCNSVKKLSTAPDVKMLTITPSSKQEIDYEVNEPNSYIEWEFETEAKDIGFGLHFKDNSSEENQTPIQLIPTQRIDTCYESKKGFFKCEKVGIYTIVFDNSYSWIYPKVLYYKAAIKSSNDYRKQLES